MLKFLTSKGLLFLVDFSPASLDTIPDTAFLDLDELLNTLKQCPSYQLDKFHTNCGLRVRVDPILNYIQAMLTSSAISLPHAAEWQRDREKLTWLQPAAEEGNKGKARFSVGVDQNGDAAKGTFAFTRAMANDPRLRMEDTLYADKMARNLFTAQSWDWTPEV